MNARTRILLALALPTTLLACAGPDDRPPSSPVAGTYRSGDLTLHLEPRGGVRLADAQGGRWMHGAHRVDGDVLVLDAIPDEGSALASCATTADDAAPGRASYRLQRNADDLRLAPLAEACPARAAAFGRRAWTKLH